MAFSVLKEKNTLQLDDSKISNQTNYNKTSFSLDLSDTSEIQEEKKLSPRIDNKNSAYVTTKNPQYSEEENRVVRAILTNATRGRKGNKSEQSIERENAAMQKHIEEQHSPKKRWRKNLPLIEKMLNNHHKLFWNKTQN